MLLRSPAAGCPLCGASHATCGPAADVIPVDIPERGDRTVGPVRKYKVNVNGTERTLKLTAEDAKQYPGARPVEDDRDRQTATAPAEQTQTQAEADEAQAEARQTPAKGRTPANKGRTPANKAE